MRKSIVIKYKAKSDSDCVPIHYYFVYLFSGEHAVPTTVYNHSYMHIFN